MTVAEKVKDGRYWKRLKQHELAKLVDVKGNYIAQIETGQRIPSARLAHRLNQVLAIDIKLEDLI